MWPTSSKDSWKRRDVHITDTESPSKRMKMKMWGETSEMINSDNEGDTIIVTNACVDEWQKRKEISFTEITTIEVRQNKKAFTILS